MSVDEYKEKYCKKCSSKNECELVYNISKQAQCVNFEEKQNSKQEESEYYDGKAEIIL